MFSLLSRHTTQPSKRHALMFAPPGRELRRWQAGWILAVITAFFCCRPALFAQEANYDEAKIPPYKLPELMVTSTGKPVTAAAEWEERRAELLELFAEEMFGRTPDVRLPMEVHTLTRRTDALGGAATLQEIELKFHGNGRDLSLVLLLLTPNQASQPVPAFVGLNFNGNHTVLDDTAIRLPTSWVRNNQELGITDNRATDQSRGSDREAWSAEKVIRRGYALATMYYGDIDPDFDDDFQNGIHALLPVAPDAARAGTRPPDAWGSIAAWSWGLSRILDYLQAEVPAIHPQQIAVMGHSRLGKTALWAGASDPRFALVVSNNSGCGGAALSLRRIGETVGRINRSFPHWFCDNYNRYNENEDAAAFDQHMLVALMAPRPVLVCSAEDDRWADPRGEFLAAYHASPAFQLLGGTGIKTDQLPPLNQLLTSTVGYRIRPGKHAVQPDDWDAYLDFADKHFDRKN